MSTLSTALREARRLHLRLHEVAFGHGMTHGYTATELKQATIEAAALESLLRELLEAEQDEVIPKQEALAL